MARLSEVAEKLNMDIIASLQCVSQKSRTRLPRKQAVREVREGNSWAEAGLGGRYESILRDPSVASAAFGGDALAAEPG